MIVLKLTITKIISIHAPAGGATINDRLGTNIDYAISIHAPAGGATIERYQLYVDNAISIHAPAGGATVKDMDCLQSLENFNPRSRRGSDR